MKTLVWDTSPLWHAFTADRLDVLEDLARGPDSCWRNVTSQAVVDELRRNGLECGLPWLDIRNVDDLNELPVLTMWMARMGVTPQGKNFGEATVCTMAQCHGAVAIIDDGDARVVARKAGLEVHGSLWVAAQAVKDGRVSLSSASGFIDTMIGTGARYPFGLGGFPSWARNEGLLG